MRTQIAYHNDKYYADDAPEISDGQYDELFRELRALEAEHPNLVTPDSPTQSPGTYSISTFASVEHLVPMLSLDNAFSDDELRAWRDRVVKILGSDTLDFVVEPKMDGLAMSLVYEKENSFAVQHEATALPVKMSQKTFVPLKPFRMC